MSTFPRLVVLAALPSSGKSTFARHLAAQHGFVHIERDAMRFERFGMDYVALSREPTGRSKELLLFDEIRLRSCDELLRGRDVVVDASAVWDSTRLEYLFPWYAVGPLENLSPSYPVANRYLVGLHANSVVRAERDCARGRDPSFVPPDHFDRPDPLPSLLGVTVVEYSNNSTQEKKRLFSAVDALLHRA